MSCLFFEGFEEGGERGKERKRTCTWSSDRSYHARI